jgi:tetratricopeptide (TPR) repeat protein
MEKASFLNLIQSENKISETQVLELEAIVNKHPYFQAAKALYLKGLKQNNNFKYNKTLRETASITCDRSVLFDYITDFNTRKTTLIEKSESVDNEFKTPEPAIEKAEEKLEIGKPLEFKQNETHSFGEWLQLSSPKKIIREETNTDVGISLNKRDLIDRFIENNPSIQPIEKNNTQSNSENKIIENSGLMTETLAKVYLEQKKYDSAIKAYEILILKYPEKSGFFADQIKNIEYLKTHKS